MATINMHMKFEIEIPKQTWLMLRKPCRLQTDGQTDRRTDKVNPVYPPPTSLGRGIINSYEECTWFVPVFIQVPNVQVQIQVQGSSCSRHAGTGTGTAKSVPRYRYRYRYKYLAPTLVKGHSAGKMAENRMTSLIDDGKFKDQILTFSMALPCWNWYVLLCGCV